MLRKFFLVLIEVAWDGADFCLFPLCAGWVCMPRVTYADTWELVARSAGELVRSIPVVEKFLDLPAYRLSVKILVLGDLPIR